MSDTMPDKKKIIIGAAASVFLKYGYDKTTMNDIAKEASMGKGSLYYYYESKEHIYIAVIEKEAYHLIGLVQKYVYATNNVRKKLELAMLDGFKDFSTEAPNLELLHFNDCTPFMHHLASFKLKFKQKIHDLYHHIFAVAKEQNVLRTGVNTDEFIESFCDFWYFSKEETSHASNEESSAACIKKHHEIGKVIIMGLIKE